MKQAAYFFHSGLMQRFWEWLLVLAVSNSHLRNTPPFVSITARDLKLDVYDRRLNFFVTARNDHFPASQNRQGNNEIKRDELKQLWPLRSVNLFFSIKYELPASFTP